MRPIIFSDEELKARHQFTQFFNTHFEMVFRSTHFHEPLDSKDLLSLFTCSQASYRHSAAKLDLHQLEHLLLYGGYIRREEEMLHVHCDIRIPKFQHFNASVQLMLLDMVYPRIAVRLQQELGEVDHPEVKKAYVPKSIRLFYDTMVFTRKYFQWYYKIPTKFDRVGTQKLLNFYERYCAHQGFVPSTKKLLFNYLLEHGYPVGKGYYNGKGGLPIIKDLAIPFEEQDMEKSISQGIGHITLDCHVCFNDGRCFNVNRENDMESMENYVRGRYQHTYEQGTAPQGSAKEQAEQIARDWEEATQYLCRETTWEKSQRYIDTAGQVIDEHRREIEARTIVDQGRESGTEQGYSSKGNEETKQSTNGDAQTQVQGSAAYHGGDAEGSAGSAIVSGVDYAKDGSDLTQIGDVTVSYVGHSTDGGEVVAIYDIVDHPDKTLIGRQLVHRLTGANHGGYEQDARDSEKLVALRKSSVREANPTERSDNSGELAERKERERDIWNGLKTEVKYLRNIKGPTVTGFDGLTSDEIGGCDFVSNFIREIDEEMCSQELVEKLYKKLIEEGLITIG